MGFGNLVVPALYPCIPDNPEKANVYLKPGKKFARYFYGTVVVGPGMEPRLTILSPILSPPYGLSRECTFIVYLETRRD